MEATITATIPVTNAQAVLGSDFVQSLKSQLKSMSGIANGTATLMIVDCSLLKVAPTAGSAKLNTPQSEAMIPTAYASTTVPIFWTIVQRLNAPIIKRGKST